MLRCLLVLACLVLACLVPACLVPGLATAQTPSDTTQALEGAPRVFVDCQTFGCDSDFFRTEIRFVNYVLDRQVADVHVLVVSQSTGGGGRAYTLDFIGLRRFAGLRDTLAVTTAATASDDDVRRALARQLRRGLFRYAARTPIADRLDVRYDAPANASAQAVPTRDPWNSWVFRANVNGNGSGEDRFRNLSLYGSLNASRVTPDSKTNFSLSGNRNAQTFELSDGSSTTNLRTSYGASALAVRSLGPHWSAGMQAMANHSDRENYDLDLTVAPTVEYSLFPYE